MESISVNKNSLATAKMCRLCEGKDGPFLNIFGPNMDLARKIEDIVLITINEYDDLPHKICFRCSAKLEDFQEFITKCIKTQQNLSNMVGKKFSQANPRTRKIKYSWEATLSENKMSNEDYCNELIKKAAEMASDFKVKTMVGDLKWIEKYNIKDSLIRLLPVDCGVFPGIEMKEGKYSIMDINKIPKLIKQNQKFKSNVKKLQENGPNTNIKSNASNLNIPSKADWSKLTSNTKIIIKKNESKETEKPNLRQSSDDNRTVPDNFTTVRVSGVGPVYTCKSCDSVLLDMKKAHSHKCINLKNVKGGTMIKTQTSLPQANETVKQSTAENNVKEIVTRNKPGPARHKQKIDDSKKFKESEIIDVDEVCKSNPVIKQPPNVSNTSNNYTPDPGLMNNFSGFQFPGNIYLVPSGNNTFALRAGPPISNPLPQHRQPSSILNQSSIPMMMRPSPAPTLIPMAVQPMVQSMQVPTDSILPDINRPNVYQKNEVPDTDPVTKRKRGRKPKDSKKNTVISPAPQAVKSPPPQPAKVPPVIIQKKKEKIVEPQAKAPYPIGLLCRNSGAGNVEPHSSVGSRSPEYPQYTILPPKTPGKIVISTVPQKGEEDSIPLKKRRKQDLHYLVDNEPTLAPQQNQHFFTYINLDSVLGPPSLLPIRTLQEPSVSTTVAPMVKESRPTKAATKIIPPPPPPKVESKPDVYTCSICDMTFSREKKLVTHVRMHYEPYDED